MRQGELPNGSIAVKFQLHMHGEFVIHPKKEHVTVWPACIMHSGIVEGTATTAAFSFNSKIEDSELK